MIAYHFPPDAAVGALRPLKFAKYLPNCGWEPYVLTVKEKYYPVLDASRGGGETAFSPRVFRTRMLPNPSSVYRRLKRAYYGPVRHDGPAPKGFQREGAGLWSSVCRWRRLVGSLLSLPDETLGWLPVGTAKAVQLLRRYKIRSIYTSGPPHSVHLMGLVIKKITGVRWIADFRDLWTLSGGDERTMVRRMERWMERTVVENADIVVTTTQRMREAFQGAYSSARGKLVTIPNGYDSEDFATLERGRGEKFRIVYLGSFYLSRTPEPLLAALSALLAEGRIEADRLDVRFVGDCEYANGRRISDVAAFFCLSRVVKVLAPVSYRQALAYMANSELLLLLAPNQACEIPAKAFEYLASGTDVLTVTEDGATADLMRGFERARVVHPEDIGGMKEAVLRCYERWRDGRSEGRDSLAQDVWMYERGELTKELVIVLQGRVAEQ